MTPATVGSFERLDPAFDDIVGKDARLEKIATGFVFTEGPLWRPDNTLWFSDIVGNVVRSWSPDGTVTEILRPGGGDSSGTGFIGPNGMTAGRDGTVILCQHGYRRIVRIDRQRQLTTVVERYEGRRLNSPNDVVFRSDGVMYFTDPPYGLAGQDDDPAKELPVNGVYKFANGKIELIIADLTRPNGLAFSPDEKTLYVANSAETDRRWMAYDVAPDGRVANARLFADVTSHSEAGVPDGFKMDVHGNMFTTAPGGVWVFTPQGRHLGTIRTPEQPANVGWGDDGRTLYITAETSLYRIRTNVAGQPVAAGS